MQPDLVSIVNQFSSLVEKALVGMGFLLIIVIVLLVGLTWLLNRSKPGGGAVEAKQTFDSLTNGPVIEFFKFLAERVVPVETATQAISFAHDASATAQAILPDEGDFLAKAIEAKVTEILKRRETEALLPPPRAPESPGALSTNG